MINRTLPGVAMVAAGLFMLIYALFAPAEASPTIWGPAGLPDPLEMNSIKIGLDAYLYSDTTLELRGDGVVAELDSTGLMLHSDAGIHVGDSTAGDADVIVFTVHEADDTHEAKYDDGISALRFRSTFGTIDDAWRFYGGVYTNGTVGSFNGDWAISEDASGVYLESQDAAAGFLRADPNAAGAGVFYAGNNEKDSIVVQSSDSLVVEGSGYLLQTDRLAMTATTHSFTTEGDLPDPLVGTILLDGDDDTDNDVLHLQDGTTAGQITVIVADANVDADDTVTIDTSTDTSGANIPAIVFDALGENAVLMWTGSTWVILSIQDNL
jgi:hypothetical protein